MTCMHVICVGDCRMGLTNLDGEAQLARPPVLVVHLELAHLFHLQCLCRLDTSNSAMSGSCASAMHA